jgi:hypothetical protein
MSVRQISLSPNKTPSMQGHFEALLDDGDEDSVFVSLADLFSLLSLTVIYIVLTFGQTVPSSSEPVAAASLEGSGPGKPISPDDTYVSIQSRGPTAVFRITRNGIESDQEAPLEATTTPKIPEEWLLSTLAKQTGSGTIFLYLPPSENSLAIKALFTDMARLLKAHFTNLHVAL